MNWQALDARMQAFAPRLIAEIGLADEIARKLATSIAADVRFLASEDKARIRNASPVALEDRLAELGAFERWLEYSRGIRNPYVGRARVVTQMYFHFVYLPEACFRVLAKAAPSRSAARKCAQFPSNNPVRAFRNAFAHGNWTYRADLAGIMYWARKGSGPDEPIERFEVEQMDLNFWVALSECVTFGFF